MMTSVTLVTASDITTNVETVSTKKSTNIETPDFVRRLYEACGTEETAEIARKVGVIYQTIDNYVKGRIPKADVLLKIHQATGVSIHWLLTEEGPKYISSTDNLSESVNALQTTQGIKAGPALIYLGEAERQIIHELAGQSGRKFEQEVREVIINTLVDKGLLSIKPVPMDLILLGQITQRFVPIPLQGEIADGELLIVFERGETVMVAEDLLRPGHNAFAFRARGDSMLNEGILDGDIIICYEAPASDGDMVVAVIDNNQATIKTIFFEDNKTRLVSANSTVQPLLIDAGRVAVYAIVSGIQRRK